MTWRVGPKVIYMINGWTKIGTNFAVSKYNVNTAKLSVKTLGTIYQICWEKFWLIWKLFLNQETYNVLND